MDRVLKAIQALPEDFHQAGVIGDRVLERIQELADSRGFTRTAETGCGKSTLLLSHLSRDHTVFTRRDHDGSWEAVVESPLANRETIRLVDGPSQRTLPAFEFRGEFDLVLLDGPHAWPFPELEYYWFYPHIRKGGYLLIDDIQIPTIARMVEILSAEPMFERLEGIERCAFFRRTAADTFSPVGDEWHRQPYNRPGSAGDRPPAPGAARRALAALFRWLKGSRAPR